MFTVHAIIGPRNDRKKVSIFDPGLRELTIHNAKITQEIGKAGSFQFVLPNTNTFYDDIEQMLTTIYVEYEVGATKFEVFRGRVFKISTDFMMMKTVVCEGTIAYLVDTVQRATSYKGKAKALLEKIIESHNSMVLNGEPVPPVSKWKEYSEETRRKLFRLGRFEIENADIIIPGPKDDEDKYYGPSYSKTIVESIEDEWLTTYDFINDIILDYLGGYLGTRYDPETASNLLDIRSDKNLQEEYSALDTSKLRQIDYGVNMLDLSKEFDPENLCTVVIPLGDSVDEETSDKKKTSKTLTIEKSSKAQALAKTTSGEFGIVDYKGKNIGIIYRSAAQKYGRIYKTHSFSNVNDANTLFEDAKRWLKKNANVVGRFTVRAVDMSFLDTSYATNPIKLGEMISVRSGQHGIDFKLMCTKIEYDLGDPGNNTYTLGNPEQTLTERYLKDKKKEDKKSKDRSRRGGSSGAAAAEDAQATADDAATKADELEKQIKGAEILVDPDNASISLKTWYKITEDAMRRAGIDIDSTKDGAKVDIYAMDGKTKDNSNRVASVETRISDSESVVELLSKHNTETTQALAQLNLRTTDLESIIEQLASYESETSLTTAAITAKADATEASVDSLVQFKDKATGDLLGMAEIKALANANASEITAIAKHHTDLEAGLSKLDIRVTNTESVIDQLAQWVSQSSITTANISTKADANGAYIDELTEFKDKATGQIEGFAQTKQWVDDHSANITQVTDWFGKNGTNALTRIAQLSDEKVSQILAATEFYTDNTSALTSIKQMTTEKMAQITSAAEFVNKRTDDGYQRAISSTIAGTSSVVDKHKALWTAFAEWTDDETGKLVSGSIKLKATALGSTLDMKADEIKVIGENIRLISKKGTFLNNVFFGSAGVYIGKTGKNGTSINLNVTGSTTIDGGLKVKGGEAVVFDKPLKILEDKNYRVAATKYWVSNQNYAAKSDLTGYFKTPDKDSTINWKTNPLIAKNYKSKGGSRVVTKNDLDEYLEDYVKKSDYNSHKHRYSYKNGNATTHTSTDGASPQL